MLRALHRRLPLTEPMDAEQITCIDAASMDILEAVGVVFRDPVAIEDWRKAGTTIKGETVHRYRALVRIFISTILETFTCHARAPLKSLPFVGDHAIFAPMTGTPDLRYLKDTRRNPTLDDLATFHKLSNMLPVLHSSAHHIVEPFGHPIRRRHLRITDSSMKHSDKTFMGMTTSPKNAEEVLDMCARLFGADFMQNASGCDRQLQRQLAPCVGRVDTGRRARLLPAQAGCESPATLQSVTPSGAHYLWHSAG